MERNNYQTLQISIWNSPGEFLWLFLMSSQQPKWTQHTSSEALALAILCLTWPCLWYSHLLHLPLLHLFKRRLAQLAQFNSEIPPETYKAIGQWWKFYKAGGKSSVHGGCDLEGESDTEPHLPFTYFVP